MQYLSNIALLALAALTFEACSSTRPTSSSATAAPAVGDTRKSGYATSTASGNIVVGGAASNTATASISGASGNSMGNQPIGTMGTAKFPNRDDLNQSEGGVAITDLKKSAVKEFDKKYVQFMIKDQKKGVALFEQG